MLRNEWEMGTADLREESRVSGPQGVQPAGSTSSQAAMLVVPSQVFYQPKFTYIWTLAVGRFPDALQQRVSREDCRPRDRALFPRRRRDDARAASWRG